MFARNVCSALWELLTGVIVTVSLWDIFVPLIGHPNTTAKNYNSYLTTLAGLDCWTEDCEKYSTKKNESLTRTNYRFSWGLLLDFNKEQVRRYKKGTDLSFTKPGLAGWQLTEEDSFVSRMFRLVGCHDCPASNCCHCETCEKLNTIVRQRDGSITVHWSSGRSRPSWDVERKYLIWQIHSSRIKIEPLPSHYTTQHYTESSKVYF